MAYRFVLGGVEVSCDSPEEVRALVRDPAVTPTSKTTRARRAGRKRDPQQQATNAREGWRVIKLYAEKYDMTVAEARRYLRQHPKAKTRFVNSLGRKK